MTPICPFCRKNVEPATVWCSCGVNLSRYPKLPVSQKEVKDWLLKYAPEEVSNFTFAPGHLLIKAKESLVKEQDNQVSEKTHHYLDIRQAQKLIEEFLSACEQEALAPILDIGQLRRERWRQWRHIPAQYRVHPPLRDFRVKPGYLIQIPIAKYVDEFCLAIDGSLYKHQLNAQDPFPLEELLKLVPVSNLAEALNATLVELLKAKQQPAVPSRGFFRRREQAAEPESAKEHVEQGKKRGFFSRGKTDEQTKPEPAKSAEQRQPAIVKSEEKAASSSNNQKKSKLRAVWQMLRGTKTETQTTQTDVFQAATSTSQAPEQLEPKPAYVPLDSPVSHLEQVQPKPEHGAKVITVKVGQSQEEQKTASTETENALSE